MDDLEQITELFIQNKFNDALALINHCLGTAEINLDAEIKLLKKKKRINEILDIEDYETIIQLSTIYIQDKKYEESKELLENLPNKSLKILRSLFNTSVSAGNLEDGEVYGHRYLTKLYNHKRFQEIIHFLKSYVELGGSEETKNKFQMKAIIGMGDINALDEYVFREELQCYLDGVAIGRKNEYYILFLELTNSRRRFCCLLAPP